MYFEVDSFLPVCDKFEFLRKSSYKKSEMLGEEGSEQRLFAERIRYMARGSQYRLEEILWQIVR